MSRLDSILSNLEGRVQSLVGWICPYGDRLRLNTDGAFKAITSNALCGGVVRDSLGYWRGGFPHNI